MSKKQNRQQQKKQQQGKQQQGKQQQSKQQRKKKFPWPIVVVGGILVVAAVFFFVYRSGTGKHGSGPPKIAVDQPKIDYGYVRFGTNKTFNLEVTNIGGAVLRFSQEPYVQVLAGC